MSDIVERMKNYIHGEPAHWEAVPEVLDEAMAEIDHLRMQHQWACQEISVAIAERNQAVDILYSLLGLEPGSSEKALAFIESFRTPLSNGDR